ncbi:glycoside hydrolase family 97 protein [Marinimicrobium agarilyticum]|uniref:glycoside hydrolase family 97 protein n=1 Tax=Marinimicrobium agarilyticum TaxID=306546 RepID=UPI0004165D4E|nr:glycoside hydrolase family 97 protein [Marinimicrobium agarilyticum]
MIRISMAIVAVILLGACGLISPGKDDNALRAVSSPDQSIVVAFALDEEGRASYEVSRRGKPVLVTSSLGLALNDRVFTRDLSIVSVSDIERVNDHYTLVHGKQGEIDYRANQRTVSLENAQGQLLNIVFRVSDDGVAFRYEVVGRSSEEKQVVEESTSFHFPDTAKGWLQPMQMVKTGWKRTNPAYEEHYEMGVPVGTPSPSEAGWVFPALFQQGDNWALITEAGMDGRFHASRLQAESAGGEYHIGSPAKGETTTGGARLAHGTLPLHSPWRVIAIGDLATVFESTLGTDLAAPRIEMDTDFVKPGLASWSWALLKDDSITFDDQKRFVDYAAAMGWRYTLVDAAWDTKIGYEKMQELVDYAAKKDVEILLWYNSSGDWNDTELTPKSELLTRESRRRVFARLESMGVSGIKVDFFPGDGQSVIQYYIDILEDAADFSQLVNFHGATLPRGLHRTYPHFMTAEGVHGFEMISFMQSSADLEPSHAAALVYTRNVFDPMDFTPTVFHEIPNIERKTTNGFQLALPVLFVSGIQHIAETPEGMATVPDYVRDFMRELPGTWDESRLLSGYPGKYAVFARRSGERWFIGGINGEDEPKTLALDLSFIGKAEGTLITDGEALRSFERRSVEAGPLELTLQPAGGFVVVFDVL